eukprot:4782579-Pyramimonas_sp.AAC.1
MGRAPPSRLRPGSHAAGPAYAAVAADVELSCGRFAGLVQTGIGVQWERDGKCGENLLNRRKQPARHNDDDRAKLHVPVLLLQCLRSTSLPSPIYFCVAEE